MKSIFSYILFICLNSFANNKVGNGGNVVECLNQKTILLDFYEYNVNAKSFHKDEKRIAEEYLLKLKPIAPKLYKQYSSSLNKFFESVDFKKDIELTEIPDSKHLFKPTSKDCKVTQAAVRNNLAVNSEKKFIIRNDLWKKLEPTQKAGLITHEIINEHFKKLDEENSIKARRVNALIYSKNLSAETFWKLIKELELPIYP